MPDPITITLPEIAGGAVTTLSILSAIIYALKKKGLITIGEPKERRKCSAVCREHPIIAEHIADMDKKIEKAETKIDNVAADISAIKSSVSGIEGYLRGKNGI